MPQVGLELGPLGRPVATHSTSTLLLYLVMCVLSSCVTRRDPRSGPSISVPRGLWDEHTHQWPSLLRQLHGCRNEEFGISDMLHL
jgi:hypothetical protein